MKNVINRAQGGQRKNFFPLVAKKKIVFICAALMAFAVTTFAQECPPYTRASGTIRIWKKEAGILDGKFTINASGDKVYFSKGNLQYQANSTKAASAPYTGKWRFALHQYDFVGNASVGSVYEGAVKCNNANISESYTGWIDLFGWATSGNSASGTHYQPWESSSADNNYGNTSNSDGTNPSTDGDNWYVAKADWGQNMGDGWRTLTRAEWNYMLNDRATGNTINATNNARYTNSTLTIGVTEIKGVILFPDNYAGGTPAGVRWSTINSYSSWGTTCTAAGWAALEAAGCVFLPAAGMRWTTPSDLRSIGTECQYWTSTAANSTSAYIFNNYVANSSTSRYSGRAVRLVKDVE